MRLLLFKNKVFPIIIVIVLVMISCGNKTNEDSTENNEIQNHSSTVLVAGVQDDSSEIIDTTIIIGANRTEVYLPLLIGKRVGIVANQTSVIFKSDNTAYTHLVDSLLSLHIDVKKVFAPEHGFRGTADAGEQIKDGLDKKTGVPIISLYGDNKKPKLEQLKETKKYEENIESGISVIDVMVFDIQDVGARFYTYISTLHYVMEACAEANIPVIVLDGPNPNGHYVDGPILEAAHKSFVGMHPIPVVHGMTIGEYAKMINGEGWLENNIKCDITVITMQNYTHSSAYSLPIKPSPNLPNDQAINLYPSLCFFEGTNVSAGRGTSKQFQIYGSPYLDKTVYEFKFIPSPNKGAKYPKYDGVLCYGEDVSTSDRKHQLDLNYLIRAYQNSIDKKVFFNKFFTKLAGTEALQLQIETGISEEEIRKTWVKGLSEYKKMRRNYLVYD